MVRSTSGSKRMQFVDRDFRTAMNIRRCMMLKKRTEELTRSNVVVQPLRLEVCLRKLKPIAVVRSQKSGRRLRVGVSVYTLWSLNVYLFADHKQRLREYVTGLALRMSQLPYELDGRARRQGHRSVPMHSVGFVSQPVSHAMNTFPTMLHQIRFFVSKCVRDFATDAGCIQFSFRQQELARINSRYTHIHRSAVRAADAIFNFGNEDVSSRCDPPKQNVLQSPLLWA
jgi:hypothetical protein